MLSLFYYVKRGGEIDLLGLGRLGTHNYKIKAQIGTWLSDLILSSFYVQRSWEEDWSLTADWHPVQQCIADYTIQFNNTLQTIVSTLQTIASTMLTIASQSQLTNSLLVNIQLVSKSKFLEKQKKVQFDFHFTARTTCSIDRKSVLSICSIQ